jgi:hypothetical protein
LGNGQIVDQFHDEYSFTNTMYHKTDLTTIAINSSQPHQ